MSRSQLQLLDHYFDTDNWKKARAIIQKLLKAEPDHHWLLTRLGTTYYEERKYSKALECSKKALKVAPRCPLVQWDYAGALDMLGRKKEAINVWKRLVRRGVQGVAFVDCHEGVLWAKSLLNDCRYRIGASYLDMGQKRIASRYLRSHLAHRKPGLPSTYSLKEAKKMLQAALE